MTAPTNPPVFVLDAGETVHRIPFGALAEMIRSLNEAGHGHVETASILSEEFGAPFTEAHVHNLFWVCRRVEAG